MGLPAVTGQIDPILGYIVPVNTSSWATLTSSTWAAFTTWIGKPADPLIWNSDPIDLGAIIDFNLRVETAYTGIISYSVYVSDTGLFTGEETETVIEEGDDDIAAFRGRYVVVTARVAKGSGLNTLISMNITASRNRFDILLTDINSADLAGDSEGRTLALGRTVSKVLYVGLSGRNQVGDGYVKEGYVTSGYFGDLDDEYFAIDYITSGYVRSTQTTLNWPLLVSKDRTGPIVCIRDLNGTYIDGEFDALVQVLPEQFMANGQISTR